MNEFSDKVLYRKCVIFGRQALKARGKFIGLLPEVFKRKLYQKRGFESIYHFAAQLAGISHDQVNRVLQIEKKYVALPALHDALVSGEISVNKLTRVASIATSENQWELAAKVKILSSRALEVFVKDAKIYGSERERASEIRGGSKCESTGESGSACGSIGESGSACGSIGESGSVEGGVHTSLNGCSEPSLEVHVHRLKLDQDIENELHEMQEKGIDINKFLREALEKRHLEIAQQKEQLAEKLAGQKAKSGHIPAAIVKVLQAEHGTKCSIPNCRKPAKTLHHTARFALTQSHDPRFLAPLCEGHHQLAHMVDTKVRAARAGAYNLK